jgi:GntR family transcriptional regulator
MPIPIREESENEEESEKQLLMLFRLGTRIRRGASIFDQVVYVAKKALQTAEFRPGQRFPSVRALATELKIHRNTAHKVVKRLVEGGWLKTNPRCGTQVAKPPEARTRDQLTQEVEKLFVEAQRVGLDLADVVHAVEVRWTKIGRPNRSPRPFAHT